MSIYDSTNWTDWNYTQTSNVTTSYTGSGTTWQYTYAPMLQVGKTIPPSTYEEMIKELYGRFTENQIKEWATKSTIGKGPQVASTPRKAVPEPLEKRSRQMRREQ